MHAYINVLICTSIFQVKTEGICIAWHLANLILVPLTMKQNVWTGISARTWSTYGSKKCPHCHVLVTEDSPCWTDDGNGIDTRNGPSHKSVVSIKEIRVSQVPLRYDFLV